MRPQVAFTSLGFAVTVLTCGNAHGQAPVTPTPPAATTEPSTAPPAAGGPTYDRKGRRDPFEPVAGVQPGTTSTTVASSQLKGILRGRTPRVLVETADGLGYLLAVGDMLGDGRLIEIRTDSVVFSVPSRRGSTPERVVLRLPED